MPRARVVVATVGAVFVGVAAATTASPVADTGVPLALVTGKCPGADLGASSAPGINAMGMSTCRRACSVRGIAGKCGLLLVVICGVSVMSSFDDDKSSSSIAKSGPLSGIPSSALAPGRTRAQRRAIRSKRSLC